MKKFSLLTLLFLLSSMAFSQDELKQNITLDKLLSVNDNSLVFTKLVKDNISYISVAKQEDFKTKVANLAKQKKDKAKVYFSKKYTQKDINEIYAEFTQNGRMNFNPKTLSFVREWRTYKREFQKEFNQLFFEFQN
jgi:hypothetical protein